MANTVFDDILGELRMGDTASGGSGGASLVGGYRTSIAGGTASFVPSADIVTVTGTSVTLNPDTAYKIYATTSAVTLNANVPDAGKWAYDGHIELFVAGTGYVVTGSNVVLANALEPDAVNNCTVRFHGGLAIISVEDHIAGYVVVSATGTTAGTLPYALTSATQEYVAFDASLNGSTIDMGGATTNGEKHLVGNGYTETMLTGAVDCGENKVTMANLGLSNVQVTGGVMTLGDAYIPNGSTVAVSGGGLAIEKVTGNGKSSVIDLGGTQVGVGFASLSNITVSGGSATFGGGFALWSINNTLNMANCKITDCVAANGGAVYCEGTLSVDGCEVVGNSATTPNYYGGGGFNVRNATISNSIISGNYSDNGKDILLMGGGLVTIIGSTIGEIKGARVDSAATMSCVLSGQNTIGAIIAPTAGSATVNVTLTSGAIVDLTGNTNTTPIAPGGGITFEAGGATVLYSSGAVSGSYMMDNVTLPAGAKLTNTATVDLGGFAECYGSASGATVQNGYIRVSRGATANNITLVSASLAGGVAVYSGGTANSTTVNDKCYMQDLNGGIDNNATVNHGGYLQIKSGGTASEPIINAGGTLIVSSGASALLVTSNTGAIVTVEDGGYITYKE